MMLLAATVPVSWSAIEPEIVLLGCACALLTFAICLPGGVGPIRCLPWSRWRLPGRHDRPDAQWNDSAQYSSTTPCGSMRRRRRAALIFAAGLLAVVVVGMPTSPIALS